MSSYNRQTQTKAQNEANAKALRALVKQPENKVCADCKRNDPRWASWNIGCFLCIRCSGIHRSMGTHISKVKSIDLDIWTPEQMASVQQWGNKRCNLYWEAHLKAGHVPPEHKVESFIRSKYETKRWAMDGPVPEDPSTLEGEGVESNKAAAASTSTAANTSSSTSIGRSAKTNSTAIDLLGGEAGPGEPTTSLSKGRSSLLDDASSSLPTLPAASTSPQTLKLKAPSVSTNNEQKGSSGGGLFDLDWQSGPTSPTMTTSSASVPAKGNKSDILSLFSATSSRQAAPGTISGLDNFGNMNLGGSITGSADPWAAQRGPASPNQMQIQTMTPNRASNNMFSTQDVWDSNNASSTIPASSTAAAPSNDIWGDMMGGGGNTLNKIESSKISTSQQNDAFADIWK